MNTHIFYREKFFVHAIIHILFWGSLGMLSMYLLWPKYTGIFLVVILFFPLLFIKSLLKTYTRSIFVELTNDFFIFEITNQKGTAVRGKFDLNEL
jgi:hypothetical protein